jgi:hypothetical protein
LLQHQQCVVLNNQYYDKIKEAAKACKADSTAITVFQPYTEKHLRSVFDAKSQSDNPIPVFLIAGNYGDVVSAVGLLTNVEYREEMSAERKTEISKLIKDPEGLYAVNVLSVSNVTLLREPLALSLFAKVTNEQGLSPGQWPASVCYFPDISALIGAI